MRLIPRPGRTAEGEAPDGDPSGDEDRPPPPGAVVALALRTVASAVAVVAAAAVVADRTRLGARAPWALALIALGVAVTWTRGWSRRPLGGWAAWPLSIATAILATALGRGPSDPEGPTFDRRVLHLDIAPFAAFLAVSCLVPVVVACLALSRVAWDEPVGHRRRARAAVRVGLAVAVAAAGVAATVSAVARAQVDARAEAASLDHEAGGTAARLGDADDDAQRRGPARPSAEPAWRAPWEPVEERPPVLVPGWDVLLAVDDLGTTLAAISTDAGATVWRYHREGSVDGVRVDPESGRVLLVGDRAVVVLDLADGSHVATRRLVGDGDCVVLPPSVEVGPVALLECDGGLVAVDAASGAVGGPLELPDAERPALPDDCRLRAATGDPAIVVRSGAGACGRPEVLVRDEGSGRLDLLARIDPPGAGGGVASASAAEVDGVRRAPGGPTLLDVDWMDGTFDDPYDDEVVAVDPGGDVRWRAPTRLGELVAVTEGAAVVAEAGSWRLLALDDGAEVARSPMGGHESVADLYVASDGERLYSLGVADDDLDAEPEPEAPDLVVRTLDDLAVEGTWEAFAPAGTWGLAVAGERLVLAAGGELVAHGAGTDPPPSTDLPPPHADAQDDGELRAAP